MSETVLVVANGFLGETPAERAALSSATKVIACDGACGELRKRGVEPDFVVGDGDSISPKDRVALGERFILRPDQSTNDLDKAVRFAFDTWGEEMNLVFLGLGGKRDDHAIANVFRLLAFLRPEGSVQAVMPHGTFHAARGEFVLESIAAGTQISVFAPYPGTRLASEGLKWPLAGVDLTDLWAGTLNEATGGRARVACADAEHPFLVYVAR